MDVGAALKDPASEWVRGTGKFLRFGPGWGASVAVGHCLPGYLGIKVHHAEPLRAALGREAGRCSRWSGIRFTTAGSSMQGIT